MGVVYEIARWSEVFETSESRKYKTLSWIAERTDFSSTGWQQGLDDFGPSEWLQVYGAWMCIVRAAATAKVRGRLCGDKGEPWSAARIARPAGVSSELIARAMEWAKSIGWLVPVDHTPEDSSGSLPERRKKNTTTEPDRTEQNRTGTERNGIAKDAPDRAVGLLSPEQASRVREGETVSLSVPSADPERPASLKLSQLAKTSPFLQALEALPVIGSGVIWHGSVFSPDRLEPEHVRDAPAEFWLTWYVNQLTADAPVLRAGNQAEAAFVVAAVYAVRRASEASLKGVKRIARLIHWIKNREVSQISTEDFLSASCHCARFFGTPLPECCKRSERLPETAAVPPRLKPEERAKPKGRKFLQELRQKLKTETVERQTE